MVILPMNNSHFLLRALMLLVVTSTIFQHKRTIADDNESTYYKITRFETPLEETIEACGFELMDDGQLAVCSRRGDIFMVKSPFDQKVTADQFSVFARGLHEPLSLTERDGWLYATQRPEVTRMRDSDGDGKADVFETFADGWGVSGDYHEYAFGSKMNEQGEMAVTLCLTGSFTSQVPFRGWAMKISKSGETTAMTSGVRSPGGIGANAQGDLFYTDNQGPWNGTCSLKPLRQGKFVGHPGGFKWFELSRDTMGEQPIEPKSGSRLPIEAERIEQLELPAVMFPYSKMGKSASGIACDTTKGKFGPFTDQMFVADQSDSTVMRVFLEQINGRYQGACFPFLKGFGSGNVGMEMTPSGSLFVGGTNRGWGSVGQLGFAVERVDWTGKLPFEIKEMRLTSNGFDLEFTKPAGDTASDPNHYHMKTYTYEYRSEYGSPEVDHTAPEITAVKVSEDGLVASILVDGLQRGHVHELEASGVRATSGEPLLHSRAYYTLNEFIR